MVMIPYFSALYFLHKNYNPFIDIGLQLDYNVSKRSTSVLGRRHIYGKENHHYQP